MYPIGHVQVVTIYQKLTFEAPPSLGEKVEIALEDRASTYHNNDPKSDKEHAAL